MPFVSVSQEVIDKAFGVQFPQGLDNKSSEIARKRKKVRMMYKGGSAPIEALKRKSGESYQSWSQRLQHFLSIRFVRFVAENHARLLYGKPPMRNLWVGDKPMTVVEQTLALLRGEDLESEGDTTSIVQDWFSKTTKANQYRLLMLNGSEQWFKDDVAPLKIWVDENEDRPFNMDFMVCEDVIPLVSPDDPRTTIAVYEARRSGNDVRWREWDGFGWRWVNAGGENVGDGMEHRLGRPPFAFLGSIDAYTEDHVLWMEDAALLQDRLVNRDSTNWAVTRAQAFAVPVLKEGVGSGLVSEAKMGALGEAGIKVNWDEMLVLEGPDADFFFANPSANLNQLRDQFNEDYQLGLRTYHLPADLAAPMAAERPMTLLFKWLNALEQRESNIPVAEAFEEDVIDIWGRYLSEWFVTFDPSDLGVEVEFPDNPLPSDQREDRTSDLELVNDGKMLEVEFLFKWVLPAGTSAEKAAEYIRALEEQREKAQPSGGEFEPGLFTQAFGGQEPPTV